ncbi:UNVERIFIED_CONTAM: hypothetical protein Sindi_0733300 [Sesamum indicum]
MASEVRIAATMEMGFQHVTKEMRNSSRSTTEREKSGIVREETVDLDFLRRSSGERRKAKSGFATVTGDRRRWLSFERRRSDRGVERRRTVALDEKSSDGEACRSGGKEQRWLEARNSRWRHWVGRRDGERFRERPPQMAMRRWKMRKTATAIGDRQRGAEATAEC